MCLYTHTYTHINIYTIILIPNVTITQLPEWSQKSKLSRRNQASVSTQLKGEIIDQVFVSTQLTDEIIQAFLEINLSSSLISATAVQERNARENEEQDDRKQNKPGTALITSFQTPSKSYSSEG